MRRQAVVAAAVMALAAVALLAVPASAAPWQLTRLPDADLFCGAGLAEMEDFVGNPNAGTMFIEDREYGGHYVIVESQHFGVFGELLQDPVSDVEGLLPLDDGRFLGKKTGLDRIECQVVSRWQGLGPVPPGMTVIAQLVLAPVS